MFSGLYDLCFRFLVFPARQRWQGQDLLGDVRRYRGLLEGPPAELADLAAQRLRASVVHAAATCPWWRERFRQSGIDPAKVAAPADLAALPLLSKDDVRAHGAEMLSAAIPPQQRLPAMTGGSTAAPMRFYRDPDCLKARWAADWVFYDWIGRKPYHRAAVVWGAMQDLGALSGARAWVRSRLLERTILLPGNRLHAAGLDRFVRLMRRFRPCFIHGYAQAVYLLAWHCQQRGVAVPGVRGITVTSEPISVEQRRVAEAAFACPLYGQYGAREFGMMAAEAPGGAGLHINPLNALVEFVGPDGKEVPPGTPGQVVVTDLLNRAMPLLRYRLGDIGIRLAPDAAGSLGLPRMDIVAGRETDFLVTPDRRFIAGPAMTLITAPGIAQLQYVQDEREAVVVRYVKGPGFAPQSIEELRAKVLAAVGAGLECRFAEVNDIPLAPSGKRQYVLSRAAARELAPPSPSSAPR